MPPPHTNNPPSTTLAHAILPADRSFALKQAANALLLSKLVVIPTETVYGLAALAHDPAAVAHIFRAKQRPLSNPLIVHVASIQQALNLAHMPPLASLAAQTFWPGPLTIVLPLKPNSQIPPITRANLQSIALRSPNNPHTLSLIKLTAPLAAPSANIAGRLSPTTAQHAAHALRFANPKPALILDDGPCSYGVESSVLAFPPNQPPSLLRPGAVTREALQDALNITIPTTNHRPRLDKSTRSPGLSSSHYAPSKPIRINVSSPKSHETLLAFGPSPHPHTYSLSPKANLKHAAKNLFSTLHAMERDPLVSHIAVAPLPNRLLGEALNDRLLRAANAWRMPPPPLSSPKNAEPKP